MKTFLFLMFSAIAAVQASADPLDQAASTKPTLRSELERGHDIAFNCMLDAGANAEKLDACIKTASKTQLLRATGTDAFSLGLYFPAAINAEILFAQHRSEIAKGVCALYVLNVKELEAKTHITDDALIRLFKMTPKGLETINSARRECL